MLKTFNDDMILTALQELTTEQTQISARIQKLEANKNTTETYTGTLDDLDAKLTEIANSIGDTETFCQKMHNGDISGVIDITIASEDFSLLLQSTGSENIIMSMGSFNNNSPFFVLNFTIQTHIHNDEKTLVLAAAEAYLGGTYYDLSQMLNTIPYTLTLYWHEM